MSEPIEANSAIGSSKLASNINNANNPNSPNSPNNTTTSVMLLTDLSIAEIQQLLNKYQLKLHVLENDQTISGSYWGDSEAGLVKDCLYVRNDTPIHSLLHEACHYVCMDEKRRKSLDTNAEGDYDEENAVCYLQILLADKLTHVSSQRMMKDMDAWGYTFRLGSAQAWFENDAEDALLWLQSNNLLDANNQPNFTLRT